MRTVKAKAKKALRKVRREYDRIFHGNCIVLLYHRVARLETDPQLLAVTPANFDSHLNYLRQHYHVLSVDEFGQHLEKRTRFPQNAVLITFDDGYADNFTEALPILEKHQMQALFYITTGTLGTSHEFWWDAIERIVLLSEKEPVVKEFALNDLRFDLQNLTGEAKLRMYNDLLPALRRMPSASRDRKIAELAEIFGAGADRASHRAMTFAELKQMHASTSAVIGAHTHLHPSLAALSYEEQLDEIATSKKILEEKLGERIKHFSYPFGTILDYNADTLRIVKELKFDLVAANYPDPVSANSDHYAFPRFLVRDWDVTEFRKQMMSFSG